MLAALSANFFCDFQCPFQPISPVSNVCKTRCQRRPSVTEGQLCVQYGTWSWYPYSIYYTREVQVGKYFLSRNATLVACYGYAGVIIEGTSILINLFFLWEKSTPYYQNQCLWPSRVAPQFLHIHRALRIWCRYPCKAIDMKGPSISIKGSRCILL